MNRFHQSIN